MGLLVRTPEGGQWRYSVLYRSERLSVTRYAKMAQSIEFPDGETDYLSVDDCSKDRGIEAREEDALLIEQLCQAVSEGSLEASVLEQKLLQQVEFVWTD